MTKNEAIKRAKEAKNSRLAQNYVIGIYCRNEKGANGKYSEQWYKFSIEKSKFSKLVSHGDPKTVAEMEIAALCPEIPNKADLRDPKNSEWVLIVEDDKKKSKNSEIAQVEPENTAE